MRNIVILSKILVITLVLIVTFLSNINAQDNQSDFQFWFDFRTYYTIDEKWIYDGDYGLRGFVSDEDWRRTYINPAFIYDASTYINLQGGMRFIYTKENDATNTFEFRPWQGARFIWPKTNYIILSQYVRLEERFTWGTDDGSSSFALRGRYRIMAKTPNLRLISLNQTFIFSLRLKYLSILEKQLRNHLLIIADSLLGWVISLHRPGG
jgi:hypothetical protein